MTEPLIEGSKCIQLLAEVVARMRPEVSTVFDMRHWRAIASDGELYIEMLLDGEHLGQHSSVMVRGSDWAVRLARAVRRSAWGEANFGVDDELEIIAFQPCGKKTEIVARALPPEELTRPDVGDIVASIMVWGYPVDMALHGAQICELWVDRDMLVVSTCRGVARVPMVRSRADATTPIRLRCRHVQQVIRANRYQGDVRVAICQRGVIITGSDATGWLMGG